MVLFLSIYTYLHSQKYQNDNDLHAYSAAANDCMIKSTIEFDAFLFD